MSYKDKIPQVTKYTEAFWHQEMLDRPLVCITAPLPGSPYPYPENPVYYSINNCYRACLDEDYDGILETCKATVLNTYYAGEALPSFEIGLGPDQYAGFLGSEIISAEGHITSWSKPFIDDWSKFQVQIDKSENGYFNKIKRMTEYAAANYGDAFMLNVPDLHSNMDALSAMRGPQALCLDLYDCPEEVLRVVGGVRGTYPEIYEMVYQAGNMAAAGTIGWSPIYSKDRSAVIQCDFSCMISPDQVRKFVIPALVEEAEYLDRCIYHYDGKGALGHLDDILAIEAIDCIQWVPGDGQPRTIGWMDLLRKIQDAGKSLWIYDWSAEEIKLHFKELDPAKTAFSLSVATPGEAEELLEYLAAHI